MNAGRLSWFGLALVLGCSRAPEGSGPAIAATTSASASPVIPELLSGAGIGPVRIGMTRAELGALGLPTKQGPLAAEIIVGPYVASFDGDRVGSVHVELRALPSGARVGGTVFMAASATLAAIAAKLPACGPVRHNTGADVIVCDAGRTQVIAGGPPGILALAVSSPERAARTLEAERAEGGRPEATWKHPGMAMSFAYPDKLLKVAQKPDGATLTSEVLGTIEDRSGQGKDRPAAFTIKISVRTGALLEVMKSNPALPMATLFPSGAEASFKEDKGYADRLTVAGSRGYRIQMGSHDTHEDLVYASLSPSSTLEVVCDYVGDMARPKVPMAVQKQACERVLATLAVKP